jgi:hypothetical protein
MNNSQVLETDVENSEFVTLNLSYDSFEDSGVRGE